MNRPKSRARSAAKGRARRSSLSPALPSPVSVAPVAIGTERLDLPLVADAMRLVDLLDAHRDRLQGVRSVLWAMSALLQGTRETTPPRAAWFELQQLANTGVNLAGEALDGLACDRNAAHAGLPC
jgi:hypothetical protein